MSLTEDKMNLLGEVIKDSIYQEPEDGFIENITIKGISLEEAMSYKYWDWTNGVGLYGFWKLYKHNGNKEYLNIIKEYYEYHLNNGAFPGKNINTVVQMLTLLNYYIETNEEKYLEYINEWGNWVLNDLPRTEEGGFQHITIHDENKEELWDDTLYMTVLFLAKWGKEFNNQEAIDEAKYQFILHIKYLQDKKTNLLFHGWTFNGRHNFAEALWGRGNSWFTVAVPEVLDILGTEDKLFTRLVTTAYKNQVDALIRCQDGETGLWHTLLDDESSYLEASASCAISAGILRGISLNILDESYRKYVEKTLDTVISLVDENGVVNQVSGGTAMGRETLDFYRQIPIRREPYGQALAMLFLIEYELLEA